MRTNDIWCTVCSRYSFVDSPGMIDTQLKARWRYYLCLRSDDLWTNEHKT